MAAFLLLCFMPFAAKFDFYIAIIYIKYPSLPCLDCMALYYYEYIIYVF